MCLSPVQIINPTKYISLKYRDRFLLSVPCGKCAECQQNLSNQWFQRAWQECKDLKGKGFLYFDTLTYADNTLPHMDDILDILPHEPCFRPIDIRRFIESLRIDFKRKYKSDFRYFISSEYGELKGRPHYHVLFWVYSSIGPLEFSSLVSSKWHFGITDGLPYKYPAYVLSHNCIDGDAVTANYLRACRYVTKYVQKSCKYDNDIDDRINLCVRLVGDKLGDDWLSSVNCQRFKSKIKRAVKPFHRQSRGFGASLLEELDIDKLFDDGCIFMPSPKGLVIPVPLSTYYKRKLFYDLVSIDGTKTWCLNDLGIKYRAHRQQKLIDKLATSFYDYSSSFALGYDKEVCKGLAEYVFLVQGRIIADKPSDNLFEKLPSVTLFNYCTLSDKEHLGSLGITSQFVGNNSIGYTSYKLPPSYKFSQFISKYVYFDEDKEDKLNKIYYNLSVHNDRKQEAFVLQQHLENVYKFVREAF